IIFFRPRSGMAVGLELAIYDRVTFASRVLHSIADLINVSSARDLYQLILDIPQSRWFRGSATSETRSFAARRERLRGANARATRVALERVVGLADGVVAAAVVVAVADACAVAEVSGSAGGRIEVAPEVVGGAARF